MEIMVFGVAVLSVQIGILGLIIKLFRGNRSLKPVNNNPRTPHDLSSIMVGTMTVEWLKDCMEEAVTEGIKESGLKKAVEDLARIISDLKLSQ